MNTIDNIVRADLRQFSAYSSTRDEAKAGRVWLNANESPYGVKSNKRLGINRYPEKQPEQLLKKFAQVYGLDENQIVLSRGSGEGIDLLVRLVCTPGEDAVIICPPTFSMYGVCTQLQGARLIEVPLLPENYQLNLEALLAYKEAAVKIIFLCSPNNPTGNLIPKEDIYKLCQEFANKSLIVVDEAYLEFADESSLASAIKRFENLVVLRTLSKAYGLAGARCGLLFAQQALVNWINKIIAPYPLPSLTARCVFRRFQPKNLLIVQQQIEEIKIERERLRQALSLLPCVKRVLPSAANFLLVEMLDAGKVMEKALQKAVVLRDFSHKPYLQNCLRISIGLPSENRQLINLLQEVT